MDNLILQGICHMINNTLGVTLSVMGDFFYQFLVIGALSSFLAEKEHIYIFHWGNLQKVDRINFLFVKENNIFNVCLFFFKAYSSLDKNTSIKYTMTKLHSMIQVFL